MLSVRSLHKTYTTGTARQRVLDGLDLEIDAGQVVALLGTSGSGKTTLLNLLSGIDSPDSGQVRIDDTDLTVLDERQRTLFRRRHIGFVFQFFNLIPTLTVGENLALPLELNGRSHSAAGSRVAELLEAVGLPDTPQRFPDTLSGGEQQRVAVARALAHRPGLLLADEPTGNLDEQTGRRVTELLVALARQHGTTLLIVTHSTQVADRADRVLQLHQGRVHPA